MRADSFPTLRTEGGLLPADLLARVAEGRDLPGLTPADYHLVAGETVRSAANRAWARLLPAWSAFRTAFAKTAATDAATGLTRDRWLQVLFSELGYGRLPVTPPGGLIVAGTAYPVSHQWGHVPIHLVGARVSLDTRTPGVAGAARSAPHSMVQELLNRTDEHLWAMVTNGLVLRLLRDNTSLVSKAYVEFDLEAMLEGEVFADFVLLYLLCHVSRVESDQPAGCWLERWRTEVINTGARALDALRDGVEQALATLGVGFLRPGLNPGLKAALESGDLPVQDYYRLLLRLVYRLLFLFIAEDRDKLHPRDADLAGRQRYAAYFATGRLRAVAGRRRGSRHGDLWAAIRVVFDGLGRDEGLPQLGLPGLGSGLFDPQFLGLLADTTLRNDDLLTAVRALSQVRDRRGGVVRTVDYRNLDSEELGSVYESLLELHPRYDPTTGEFTLVALSGSERKTTGSYYTPTSLVDRLLMSALDPLLDEASAADDPERALLSLTVCDPAVGSGHFLVAAARRIAKRLAQVRTDEAEPPPAALDRALRDVVGRCLYGVDINDLAAELAKVSLWLEAMEPGRPLSFLDHRIKVGNSLLGTTPTLLAAGVPDAAFKPIAGDDRQWAAALAKRNRQEREQAGQIGIDEVLVDVGNAVLGKQASEVAGYDDRSLGGVRARADAWQRLETSPELAKGRLLADAWCAAFVWEKTKSGTPAPTTRVLRDMDIGPAGVAAETVGEVNRLARAYRFFHWHLEFPDVFRVPDDPAEADDPALGWSGGFSCVLGNPPWEHTELKEQEFFASRAPEIAAAAGAVRKRLIADLEGSSPLLWRYYQTAKRMADGLSQLARASGRYPLCGRGRINTYALFAETDRALLGPRGRLGVILPTGIATDATTQYFFRDVVESGSLASLYDFENARPIFEGVHRSFKFCLLTLTGRAIIEAAADFAFFVHDPADLDNPDVRFALKPDEITLLNPNTGTCSIFRSRRDAEITLGIYRRVPVLVRDGDPDGNPWGLSFMQGLFNMTSDSGLFRTREQLENDGWQLDGNVFVRGNARMPPLYEAKMLHHYDHRWATYDNGATRELTLTEKRDPDFVVQPRYWVAEKDVRAAVPAERWDRPWLFSLRKICRTTDERTFISSALPMAGAGDSVNFLLTKQPGAFLVAWGASLIHDHVARQKLGGTNFAHFITAQLPSVSPDSYRGGSPWSPNEELRDWIADRVLELTYTAWDMEPFADDLGYDGPPFVWDEERRALMRAELDAAYFHLYGIVRDDVDYILGTFPIVRRKDEQRFGEFRTKRLILDGYDRMAAAMSGGPAFTTVLDPPPGQGPTHPDVRR